MDTIETVILGLHAISIGSKAPMKVQLLVSSYEKRSLRTSKEKIIFDPDCIFYNKSGRIHVKKERNRTKESTRVFKKEGWKTVIRIAEENNDENLLLRIRGYDLFACEARYHPSCRRKYTMKPKYWRSQHNQSVAAQTALEDAHKSALHHVVAYGKEHVIEQIK